MKKEGNICSLACFFIIAIVLINVKVVSSEDSNAEIKPEVSADLTDDTSIAVGEKINIIVKNDGMSNGKEVAEYIWKEVYKIRPQLEINLFGQEQTHNYDLRIDVTRNKDKRSGVHESLLLGIEKMEFRVYYLEDLGYPLRHELIHTILNQKIKILGGNKLMVPRFINEGFAYLTDMKNFRESFVKIEDIESFNKCRMTSAADKWINDNFPDFSMLLDNYYIVGYEQGKDESKNFEDYIKSYVMTKFLLTKGDAEKLLKFAIAAQKTSYDKALKDFYGINGKQDFQEKIIKWIKSKPDEVFFPVRDIYRTYCVDNEIHVDALITYNNGKEKIIKDVKDEGNEFFNIKKCKDDEKCVELSSKDLKIKTRAYCKSKTKKISFRYCTYEQVCKSSSTSIIESPIRCNKQRITKICCNNCPKNPNDCVSIEKCS